MSINKELEEQIKKSLEDSYDLPIKETNSELVKLSEAAKNTAEIDIMRRKARHEIIKNYAEIALAAVGTGITTVLAFATFGATREGMPPVGKFNDILKDAIGIIKKTTGK